MSNKSPINIPASVRQRLLNLSRQRGEDFQYILTRYAVERLLFRLGHSEYSSKFILKGATLIAVWSGKEFRPTRDIDFLGYGDYSDEELIKIFRDICSIDIESDGIKYDLKSINIDTIREDNKYMGNRVKLFSKIENTRIRIQIDIAYGDTINPKIKRITYPTLLDYSAPNIFTYPPESVIAEKLHAMISLGMVNTRMKDIYDILVLARTFSFDGAKLTQAIKATFKKRNTNIPRSMPVVFSDEFIDNKEIQWKAFLTRSGLESTNLSLSDVIQELQLFILPPIKACASKSTFTQKWQSSKTWE